MGELSGLLANISTFFLCVAGERFEGVLPCGDGCTLSLLAIFSRDLEDIFTNSSYLLKYINFKHLNMCKPDRNLFLKLSNKTTKHKTMFYEPEFDS